MVLMGQYVARSKVGGDVRSSTALNQILRNAAQSAASDEIVKRIPFRWFTCRDLKEGVGRTKEKTPQRPATAVATHPWAA